MIVDDSGGDSKTVKHPRYPLAFKERKPMTIAAGFVNKDGVLLCADSQQEHGSTKFYSPKVCDFSFAAGQVGFAFAGNSAFAASAIQKCSERLRSINDPDEVIPELEKVLDRQYRKNVYAHPDRLSDWNIPYWLMIGFRHPKRGAFLFTTHETTLRSIVGFECIGIGRDLGHFLANPSYSPLMGEDQAVRLATYMLNRVKAYVPGCGGPSTLLALRHDGTHAFLNSHEQRQVDEASEDFDKMAQSLFFSAADNNLGNEAFEEHMAEFGEWLRNTRKLWKSQRDFIRSIIESTQGAQSSPGPTTHDPPSQEQL